MGLKNALRAATFVVASATSTAALAQGTPPPPPQPTISDAINVDSGFSVAQIALVKPLLNSINFQIISSKASSPQDMVQSDTIERLQEILDLEKKRGFFGPETSAALLKLDAAGIPVGKETLELAKELAPETYTALLQKKLSNAVDLAEGQQNTITNQANTISEQTTAALGTAINHYSQVQRFVDFVKDCVGETISGEQQEALSAGVLDLTTQHLNGDINALRVKLGVLDLVKTECRQSLSKLAPGSKSQVESYAEVLAKNIAEEATQARTLFAPEGITPETADAMLEAGVISPQQRAIIGAAAPSAP